MAENLKAEDGSVGIRVTKDAFCQALVRKLNKPIVSTSANISGDESPKNFDSIDAAILEDVDYVVEHRQDEYTSGKASCIMKLGLGGEIKILRK